jgi:enterochelin esterase-like enzyme
MSRFKTAAFILLPLLSGCAAAPITSSPTRTPTVPACTTPGVTQWLRLDAETEIGLYLPPCFDEQATRSYPVLYLFPGFSGSNRDFLGLGADAMADALILDGEVPSFLIVTTEDVFPDLDGQVVVEKILPYIESHYRAGADRMHRAAAGGSFGGAVAYHLAFKRPDLFASAGIFGNGAALGEEESIRAWLAAIPAKERPRVFLCAGESDTYMFERARVMIPLLDEAGIAHNEIFSPGGHTGEYWTNNFPAYFRWLASDWR